MFSDYNKEQLEAINMVKTFIISISSLEREAIKKMMKPYLEFRSKVSSFHEEHLSDICTTKCFLSRESACCNRDIDNALYPFGKVYPGALGHLSLNDWYRGIMPT